MKVLITGANGMLAKSVKKAFKNYETMCSDVQELDITNYENVKSYITDTNPDIIINCAAYTAVDKAEEDKELAYKINAEGPKNLAIAAEENNCILIHVSTDYVFGGTKEIPYEYKEDDEKNPQSVYGSTKLEGEKFVTANASKYYIFRTAWLYGEGKNFVRTMIELSKTRDEVKVVNDQFGSPTYAEDLASIMLQAVEKKIPFGIYNSTNIGNTNWFEFTKLIFSECGIQCKVLPVSSEEFNSVAKRPKNSQMSKEKLLKNGIDIPTFQDGLKRYLKSEGRI